MREIWTLAGKDLRLLLRDKGGLFFTLVFPLVIAIFFGSLASGSGSGGHGEIPVAVVDEDHTPASEALASALEANDALRVQRSANAAAARASVRKGNLVACIDIPEGFGAQQRRMFYGEPAKLKLSIDPARKAEAGMLKGLVTQAAFRNLADPDSVRKMVQASLADLAKKNSAMPESVRKRRLASLEKLQTFVATVPEGKGAGGKGGADWTPIRIESMPVQREKRGGPPNAFSITFPQGILWGILGCAATFAISLVVERRRGTLVRLAVAPLGRARILAGKALACAIAIAVVCVLLLGLAVAVFGVRPGSYPLLALAIACVAGGFVGIMMLLSTLGRTEGAASGIGWAFDVIAAMIGGGMIPLFFMPSWMRTLGSVSPVKWGILALEGALWRGFTLSEMLLPCGILLGIGALCFALGTAIFRWAD